jgi:hypothetical protein
VEDELESGPERIPPLLQVNGREYIGFAEQAGPCSITWAATPLPERKEIRTLRVIMSSRFDSEAGNQSAAHDRGPFVLDQIWKIQTEEE